MNPSPNDHYLELRVRDAPSEQAFLQLAVQAAIKTYRGAHRCLPASPVREERVAPRGSS